MGKWPVIRQVSLLGVLISSVIMVGLILLFRWIHPEYYLFDALLAYWGLHLIVRFGFSYHHRRGIRFHRKEDFENAISCFERSYRFFTRHRFLDRFRYLFLLSLSAMSYREMALINWAFCLVQVGEREKAIEKYKECLREYPHNRIARASLTMMGVTLEEDAGEGTVDL